MNRCDYNPKHYRFARSSKEAFGHFAQFEEDDGPESKVWFKALLAIFFVAMLMLL